MDLIILPRGGGKTSRLLEWAAVPETPGIPRYACVAGHAEARQFVDLAEHLGLDVRFPLTYEEVLDRSRNGRALEVGIDNAEAFIARATGPVNVTVITLTTEQPVPPA